MITVCLLIKYISVRKGVPALKGKKKGNRTDREEDWPVASCHRWHDKRIFESCSALTYQNVLPITIPPVRHKRDTFTHRGACQGWFKLGAKKREARTSRDTIDGRCSGNKAENYMEA